MPKILKVILRLSGIGLIGVAIFASLPSPYPLFVSILGIVMFLAAGST